MTNAKANIQRYEHFFCQKDEEYSTGMKLKMETVLELLEKNPGSRFLDVGCGSGFFTPDIERTTGASVYGVDIAEKALRIAKKRGTRVTCQDIDGKKIRFRDDYFDGAFCGDVIEHLINTEYFIKELGRVVRPRGYVIAAVPNLAAWYNRLLLLLGELPLGIDSTEDRSVYDLFGIDVKPFGHVRGFTTKQVRALFEANGFTIEQVRSAPLQRYQSILDQIGNNALMRFGYAMLCAIEALVSKVNVSLASCIIIKARKT